MELVSLSHRELQILSYAFAYSQVKNYNSYIQALGCINFKLDSFVAYSSCFVLVVLICLPGSNRMAVSSI